MANSSFEQDIFIAAAPAKVHAFLSTLNNHTQIHPLIINIKHLQTKTAADGREVNQYRIQDRVKQGPFTMTISYEVEMSIDAQGVIIYDAHQFPAIYLHNTTACVPEGNGTRLKERVEIKAPGLMMNTVYTQAQTSHKEMFETLKRILE